MTSFPQLLEALSSLLGIPLHAEKGFLCKIHLGQGLRVHLEYNEEKQTIMIVFFLPPLSPGFFRENMYLEALKDNDLPDSVGTFAYAEGTKTLVLQLLLSIDMQIDQILTYFSATKDKAMLWKDAIEQNTLSLVQKPAVKNAPSPFTFLR